MKKNINPLPVRVPAELKERIDAAAGKNKRSLNAELLVRLEKSFQPPLADYTDDELIAELMRRYGRDGIYIRIGRHP